MTISKTQKNKNQLQQYSSNLSLKYPLDHILCPNLKWFYSVTGVFEFL